MSWSKSEYGLNGKSLDQLALSNASAPVTLAVKVERLLQILKHYRITQIGRRICKILSNRVYGRRCVGKLQVQAVSLKSSPNLEALAEAIVSHHSEHPSHSKSDLATGNIVLLNHGVEFNSARYSEEILNSQSHLWRFQFHYHEFLLNVAAQDNWAEIEAFIKDWLEAYDPETIARTHDSWHPYCISRRVVVWVWLMFYSAGRGKGLSDHIQEQMLVSLVHQATYLAKNMEWELGGNHLLENATAIAVVGGVLKVEIAEALQNAAFRVLSKELPKQVLHHGEYFERSPMYHCQITSNLLRVVLCNQDDLKVKSLLEPIVRLMLDFLQNTCHPDGEMPLLSDSVFHEAPSIDLIRTTTRIVGYPFLRDKSYSSLNRFGNYFRLQSKDTFAICDYGSIAAPTLPAHAHCDALNLEVSIEGDRWVVDSGNYNYEDDEMRHYCRSSIGHNVVTVDDMNQANVWSVFRMGDRPNVRDQRSGAEKGWSWASAAHDGYAGHGVKKLARVVAMYEQSLICCDMLNVSEGMAVRSIVGYIHFHPAVVVGEITKIGDKYFQVLVKNGACARVCTLRADTLSVEHGWYCEEFGRRRRAAVIRYAANVKNLFVSWALHHESVSVGVEACKTSINFTVNESNQLKWKRLQ